MKNSKFTYQKSGVNISSADKFVEFLSKKKTGTKKSKNLKILVVLDQFQISQKNSKTQKLLQATDGVGTKIEIANELNKFDTIGIDLVAMCVNDLIVQGAKPLNIFRLHINQ